MNPAERFNPQVEYRDIPGHAGYRAGSDGSIWSCWKRIPKSVGKAKQYELSDEWFKMRPRLNKCGYYQVKVNGKRRKVCRLVLEAFHSKPPGKMECRHLNGISGDDRSDNLTWGTHKQNIDDKIIHGTHQTGEKHGCHKLTEDQVRQIRREYAAGGISQRALARKYGVSQGGCIGPLLRGKIWRYTT